MATRPDNTYIDQVINPGIDKNIPVGFVDVVYDRSGKAVGFMRDGAFYELGAKAPKGRKQGKTQTVDPTKNMSNEQVLSLAYQMLGVSQLAMDRSQVGSDDYNKAKENYNKAQDKIKELEPLIKSEKTKTKSEKNAKDIQNKISILEEKKTRLSDQGQDVSEIDSQIAALRGNLTTESSKAKIGGPETVRQADKGVVSKKAPVASATDSSSSTTNQPSGGTGGQSVSSVLQKAGKIAKEAAGKTPKERSIDEIYDLATREFGAIDLIFKQDNELKKILTQAVNENWTESKFTNAIQNTTWFKSKAPELKTREFNKRQYRDLLQQPNADKQALFRDTEYGRGLARTIQMVKDNAIATGAAIDDATAEIIAQDLYDSANETDPYSVRNQIRARISYKPGTLMGGQAGTDLRELQNTARANGLNLDTQFANSIQGWLQRLNQGESIETFKQIIRNTARAGLPDKVGALIDQGVDLDTIYSPYKNMMAATLEVNPETIQLNDPTLRMAIGPDKEMSLYDYQRALRKDPRWQYTDNARSDVSKAALQVLRDFGFQG